MAEMSKQAAEAKRAYYRAYMKKWRAKNPEKLREYQRTYWERKAAKMNATGAENE
jgi:hypothetical protein